MMKTRHVLLSLILTISIILSFIPSTAFVEAAADIPLSIGFTPVDSLQGNIGSDAANDDSFLADGNILTLTYSDKTETYKCVDRSYYLDGDNSSKKTVPGFLSCRSDKPLKEGANSGYIELFMEGDEDDNGGGAIRTDVTITGVADKNIRDLKFTQPGPVIVDYDSIFSFDDELKGCTFSYNDISYSADQPREVIYTYKEDPENRSYYGFFNSYGSSLYYFDYSFVFDTPRDDWIPGNTYSADVYLRGVKADGQLTVEIPEVPTPVEAVFVPADGFTAEGLVGQTELWGRDLAAKGNKFVLTMSDGSTKEYKYKSYYSEEEEHYIKLFSFNKRMTDVLQVEFSKLPGLKKGINTVTGTARIHIKKYYDSDFECPFTVNVKASKYYVYTNTPSHEYTGKIIKPKMKVYAANDDGKIVKLKSSKYTCKYIKSKSIGRHKIEIKFKKKKDQQKYGKSLMAMFMITPKAPKLVSVTPGSGSVKLRWKKQKDVESYKVMVSEDKSFKILVDDCYNYISPKKTSYTVKGLERGKTYYVRVESYQNKVYSNTGKVKKVTVK